LLFCVRWGLFRADSGSSSKPLPLRIIALPLPLKRRNLLRHWRGGLYQKCSYVRPLTLSKTFVSTNNRPEGFKRTFPACLRDELLAHAWARLSRPSYSVTSVRIVGILGRSSPSTISLIRSRTSTTASRLIPRLVTGIIISSATTNAEQRFRLKTRTIKQYKIVNAL